MITEFQRVLRKKGLFGSDAAPAAGLSPWKPPQTLYLEKRGEIEPQDISGEDRVHFGNLFEDMILKEVRARTGWNLCRVNETLWHPKHPFIGAHLDGRIRESRLKPRRIFEAKTVGEMAYQRGQWGEPGTDQVPPYYHLQASHYLAVTGADLCEMAVLIGGQKMAFYTIERNDRLIDKLLDIECAFWERVQTAQPPAPQTAAQALALYPRHAKDKELVLNEDVAKQLRALREIRERLRKLKADEALILDDLYPKLADASLLIGPGGRLLAKFNASERGNFDSRRLKKEMPDVYARYVKPASVVRKITFSTED